MRLPKLPTRYTVDHADANFDNINDCMIVFSNDFEEPLIGDYRGVQIAQVNYTPSLPDSVKRAEMIAEIICNAMMDVAAETGSLAQPDDTEAPF